MVRVLTKEDLEVIESKGGSVERTPKPSPEVIQVSGLEAIVEHFHQMKHEQQVAHDKHMAQKLAKAEELITAVRASKVDVTQLTKLVAELVAMKVAHEKRELEEDDDEPCTYKLTGRRDQRGLIDLEFGLTFTPVDD